MNPLTQIKNTQKISRDEIAAGYSDSQSWHARFKHSAYIFAGGLPYKLTDGDLLAIFSQYGEIVDVNLVRHKETGKPRGFAFLAYEDQRSTNLAVDNLNGMKVGGRMITVDHVDNYKRKRAEAEGREESESEDEMEEGDAEAAVLAAAAGEGAQIISAEEATVHDKAGEEDAPWASKTSVHALLNAKLPAKRPEAAEEEEDPLALMKKQKKEKKEKKSKKKKEKKEKKEGGRESNVAPSDDSTPERDHAERKSRQVLQDSEYRRRQEGRQRRQSRSPERSLHRDKHGNESRIHRDEVRNRNSHRDADRRHYSDRSRGDRRHERDRY